MGRNYKENIRNRVVAFLDDLTLKDIEKPRKLKFFTHHLEDLDLVLLPIQYGNNGRDAQPEHIPENIHSDVELAKEDEPADEELITEAPLRRNIRQ